MNSVGKKEGSFIIAVQCPNCIKMKRRKRKYKFSNITNAHLKPKNYSTVLLSVSSIRNEESESPTPSPLSGPGLGGHKPSFRSTKLARRARSFKDDFLGKISQIRSPAGSGTMRSHSPKGGRFGPKDVVVAAAAAATINDHHHNSYSINKGPIQELDDLWKQIQIALKHFRDVVSKQILEMLPGNGTIVLDTVWLINLAVKSSASSDSSNSILSATNHMYQSVARLIKLCDDVLIDNKSSELCKENVEEIVVQVEDAVQDLIKLAQEKISQQQKQQQQQHHHQQQQINYKTTPRASFINTTLDMPTQRNSLPDIPLTPREREILEQTTCGSSIVRSSHSSESILRDSSPPPPPKPPLPEGVLFTSTSESNNCITPPPLPPKKKNYRMNQLVDESFSPITSSLERVSIRSKSPEDSYSLLSASAGSLDSMLNQSREEDEIKALMDPSFDNELIMDNHTSDIFGANGSHSSWDDSSLSSNISNHINDHLTSINDYHRLSNTDSGIVSCQSSLRSSSYSKRSSQQSSISSQWGTTIQQHQQQHISKQQHNLQSEVIKNENLLQHQQQQQQQNINKLIGTNDLSLISMKSYNQKSCSSSSSTSTIINNAYNKDEVDFGIIDDDNKNDDDLIPPAIPMKTRKKIDRQPSPYDNVPESNLGGELLVTCQMHQSHQSLASSTSISSGIGDGTKPPPLPPKKKHMFQSVAYSVMAYMEMFGNCSHASEQEYMRHSVHMVQSQWAQPSSSPGLPSTQSCSFTHSTSYSSSSSSRSHTQILNLPSHSTGGEQRMPSPSSHSPIALQSTNQTPPALPPKMRSRSTSTKTTSSPPTTPQLINEMKTQSPTMKILPDLLEHTTNTITTPLPSTIITTPPPPPTTTTTTTTTTNPTISNNVLDIKENEHIINVNPCDIDLMEHLNVEQWLVMKKFDEDGPDIRGGPIDALIIQATKATKNGVFIYQEAFLTTYRTFITPCDLVSKLIKRYNHFYYQPDKKPRSREAFALIVRVVSDLTASDLIKELQCKLMNFVQQLITCGELTLAKALRVKHLERHEAKQLNLKYTNIITSLSLNVRNFTLLDFKSEQIAEQMTLLDSELFMKIEIPEVLIWAQEQNEERSPNLTRFTEHFNKMSYWARTKILTTEIKDIREKYFLKFIKIMKHLRKINNFNSYLALLSALDSAPVRRLEWQKHVQEGLKEYCALIDSSSSFRAYRQALADTHPPCIPYIGLVLQDLTFVHIGNSNLLPDGTINFSKRWQQFNIVENMKKFKKGIYTFKRNERIIQFFQNFDDFIGEDAMWQLSESIKPRGGKKTS